jgi:WD40 repeat protein
LAFTPDASTLVTASRDRTVKLWNVESGKPAGTILGHLAQLQTMALAPDGRSLATGGYDHSVKIWGLPPIEERDSLRGHVGAVATVGFSPDGKLLASAGADRFLRIWNVASGRPEATIPADAQRLAAEGHTASILRVAYSPDGETLATADLDGIVKLWQARTGNLLATWKAGEALVLGLAYHPAGKTLITGDYKGVVTFWDTDQRQVRTRIQAHADYVMSLDCALTGELLASAGSLPYTLKLWDAVTGQERGTISKNVADSGCVAFHPGCKLLVSGTGEGTVLLFDIETQELRQTLKGHTGGVYCLTLTTDGKRLAVGSGDGTIKIWDLTAWQDVATLPAHRLRVSSIAFSPDNKTLASSHALGRSRKSTASLEHGLARRTRRFANHSHSECCRVAPNLDTGWSSCRIPSCRLCALKPSRCGHPTNTRSAELRTATPGN